jgi:hypothetical protein
MRLSKAIMIVTILACALPLAQAGVITYGLVGYWTGNGTADDSSATANNGTFSGSYGAGTNGQALAFNTGTGQVYVPNNPAYAVGSDFSVGFWFDYSSPYGALIADDNGYGFQQKWLINYQGDFLITLCDGATANFLTSSSVVLPAGWNQFTLVDDGGTWTFYLNGGSIGSAAQYGPPLSPVPTAPLTIGGSSGDGYPGFDGLMQDVVIYDRALSGSEVGELAQTGSATPEPTSLAMLGSGLLMVVGSALRRARRGVSARLRRGKTAL